MKPGLVKGLPLLFCLLLAVVMLFPAGCAPKKLKVTETGADLRTRDSIVDYAVTLLGRPYRSGAKGPNGFDCSGLVFYVYQRFDLTVPLSTEGLVKTGYEVSRDDVLAGDVVIFQIKREMHVGIMINALEFIHASKSRGVAIDSLDIPYWQRYFSQFRRII
jgi:cell wall-associated NlpC family hydrolase